MRRIERIDGYGFHHKIKLVTTNNMRLGTGAFISGRPVFGAILFDLVQELVGPQIFDFHFDILGDCVVLVAAGANRGYRRFAAIDYEIYWDLK